MKANKIKIKNFLYKIYTHFYNNVIRPSFFAQHIPFPLIDKLPDDISEFLQLDKSKFLESMKSLRYREIYKDYKINYDNWLQTSYYYFYDLAIWHRAEKVIYIMDSIRQYFESKNLDILDFGSGIGTRSLIYAKRNNVTLVEINEKLLAFSEWRFKKYNLKGEFYTKIPENKKYDIIMVLDVIGHLTDPINIMNKICSSLKKNGILRITFDNLSETSKGGIHRNKEIDFHKLFLKNGLKKIFSTHYLKL